MILKTILVDNLQLFRKGLAALLKNHEQVEVVAEGKDGREAIALAKKYLPKLMIIDPSMPELNGIEATARIKRDHPKIQVIALSMYCDRQSVSNMLAAGASGYLLKSCDEEELFQAIDLVAANKMYLSPEISCIVVDELVNPSAKTDLAAVSSLSSREREILQLIAEGRSAKEIASQLNVSARTIDSHRQHIMSKVGLYTIAEMTKFAVKAGLTPL